ncbi:MAG: HAMP domain-containing protein [Chloroflexi bacterium]|nr:HAMP domain-containing protein [Chloroflexota bacterium]
MRLTRSSVPRPSIRLRLTLWYGGLLLLAGTTVLAFNVALVARTFPSDSADLRENLEQRLQMEPGELRGEFLFLLERPQPPSRPVNPRRAVSAAPLFNSVISHIKSDTLDQIIWQSSVAFALMAALSIGLGWLVAGRLLRPVHEIAATARRIGDESLDERIDLTGPSDELKDLADQFDAMLDRLQSAFRAQREFVANASHELRTPLTIIRTEIDVTLEDPDAGREQLASTASVVRRAIDRTEDLIDRLLVLARAEEPLAHDEETDLAEAVRRAVDAREAEIAALELRLTLRLDEARVEGDPMLLDRLAGNLVDNAVQHNERGGWIEITSGTDGETATLRVANGGAPIAEDEAPRLFERFTRLEGTRTRGRGGYGLGLSIVRAIVNAHRGAAAARALPRGGLAIEISLPRRRERTPR